MSASSSWDDDNAVVLGPEDVQNYNEAQVLPLPPYELARVRAWLKPTAYDADNGEYRKHLTSHLTGTGDWLCDAAPFKAWRDGDEQGMLWVKGIPGSGKSVMAASLVERLAAEGNSGSSGVPVLFFFFRQIIDANHAPAALLRDWLDQLLPYSPPLQVRLKEHIGAGRDLESFTAESLWDELTSTVTALPRVYFVVDALDEMDRGNDDFLRRLASLGSLDPGRLKVLITSRPVASVEGPLRLLPMLKIRLEDELVDRDIRAYVASRLATSSIPETQHDAIEQAVPGRANGLFLYAKLAMDAFLKEGADVHEVMELLPLDLNDIYERLLREHAQRSLVPRSLQILILSWVTHASRPLRLLEIAEMIRFEHDSDGPKDLKSIKELVRTACGPLLEILPDETVCVIHHSLTEFLNGSTRSTGTQTDHSYPVLDMGSTHSLLAKACISYMIKSGCLDAVRVSEGTGQLDESHFNVMSISSLFSNTEAYEDAVENDKLPSKYPFLTYCLESCKYHLKKAEDSSESLEEELTRSVESVLTGRNFTALTILIVGMQFKQTPLHVLARWGLSKSLSLFIGKADCEVDAKDARGETALLYAASDGHDDTVKTLLTHGADPDEPSDHDGYRPLHKAARNDHGGVADLLLSAGVSPMTRKAKESPGNWCGNAPRSTGHTALMYVMEEANRHAAAAFIRHLKDTKTVSRALSWAAGRGDVQIVRSILAHPLVDVNARVRGDTPLFTANYGGRTGAAAALLEAGADPSIMSWWSGPEFPGMGAEDRGVPDDWSSDDSSPGDGRWEEPGTRGYGYGFNALHSLCGCQGKVSDEEELRRCVALMLDAGIDVNVKDEYGQTPLFLASTWSATLVELLLEAGADATAEFPGGDSCLHTTTDAKIAQLLVQKGHADINKKRHSDGQTALLGAIAARKYPLAKQLVDLGADPTATDADGRGPLHLLVTSAESYVLAECEITLKTLLAAGVSPNARDHAGRTPLHGLKKLLPSQEKFVRMLVEAGADVNARDHMGSPLLFNFAKSTRRRKGDHDFTPEVLQTLLDLGVRLDAVDYEGRNVLFCYFEHENVHSELVQALVLAGTDPHARDLAGNTLWHNALTNGPNLLGQADVEALKQLNVDVEARNNAGQSAVHIIAAHGPKNLALGLELFPAVVDAQDNDGIRPLHIACREFEESVAMLLAAGASPTEPTHEGITPLHVAARFCQPNIMGMLLEKIRESHDPQALAAHLNMARRQEPSALHVACRSGSPETVALLLAAGADPNLQDCSRHKLTPLRWAAQYEDEGAAWRVKKDASRTSFGIKMDELRCESPCEAPRLPRSEAQHVGRVEDVLNLLHSHGAEVVLHKEKSKGNVLARDNRTDLDKAIEDSLGKDYTTACLVNFWQRLVAAEAEGPDGDDGKLEPASYVRSPSHENGRIRYPILAGLNRREASLDAFKETKPWQRRHPHYLAIRGSFSPNDTWSLDRLINEHQWDSIRYWFENDPDCFSRVTYNEDTKIAALVRSGLDSLVGDLLTPERLAEREEKMKALEKSDRERNRPLLQTACGRKHGNVPMLRCLVEKVGVDVDEQKAGTEYFDGGSRPVDDDSALHVLAAGTHWWQAAEGLPYLLSKGASLELRDKAGRTPLLRAVERGGSTGRRAARVLVEAGADVNAVDNLGRSCLAVAGSDTELVKLLLDRGAEVTASAIISAIAEGNAERLDTLLQRASPDARTPLQTTNKAARRRNRDSLVDDHEMYPLYHAALQVPNRFKEKRAYAYDTTLNKAEVLRQHLPCIEVLVRRGADPFVTYMRGRVAKENTFGSDEYVDEEATLLHDLLEEGGLVRPILENIHDTDLDRRDARGRTPLLAACRSQVGPDYSIDAVRARSLGWREQVLDEDRAPDTPSAVELLLSKGASAAVQDNEKKNALHHILNSRLDGGIKTMRRLLECAPELVHQIDDAGETPLHYALRRHDPWNRLNVNIIGLLIDAGADATIPDKEGNTALHRLGLWLADKPSGEADGLPYHRLFRRCLSLGLPINGRNQKGETPLFSFIAAQGGDRSQSYDPGEHERQKTTLDMLHDAGADVLTANNEGDTLLHVVASTDERWRRTDGKEREKSGQVMVERFQWLVDRGLDPMRENLRSQTSLDVAALNSNTMILDLF